LTRFLSLIPAVALSVASIVACSSEPDRPPTEASESLARIVARDAAIEIVSARLVDPESARFSRFTIREVEGVTVVCGYVSARNQLGGYTPPQRFVASGDAAFFAGDIDPAEWREVWLRACGVEA
jgi:hypothetical protein